MENLVGLSFLQSVSYIKPSPTHQEIFALGNSGPNATSNLIFVGLGWPWVGEFVGFIIIFICFPTQQYLVYRKHPKASGNLATPHMAGGSELRVPVENHCDILLFYTFSFAGVLRRPAARASSKYTGRPTTPRALHGLTPCDIQAEKLTCACSLLSPNPAFLPPVATASSSSSSAPTSRLRLHESNRSVRVRKKKKELSRHVTGT